MNSTVAMPMVVAILAMTAVTPAYAACEFRNSAESIDLSVNGTTDPYADNFVRAASIAINDDCGPVWIEYDRNGDLTGGGAIVPVGITLTTGTATPGSNRRRIDADQTAIDLRIAVGLQDRGVPASGTYTRTGTFTLYDSAVGGNRIGSTLPVTLSITVAQVMTLSLNGGGLSSGSRIDLGQFEEGVTRSGINPGLNLTAVSNDPHRIEVESRNGWRIVNGTDGRYAIPYSLRIDGQTITGNPGGVGTLGSTDSGGVDRPISFTVMPGNRLRAGTYEDEVTITIFGAE